MEVDAFKKSIAAQMGMDVAQLADMSVEQIGQMMHMELESFMQEKEDDDGNTKTVECVDVRGVFFCVVAEWRNDKRPDFFYARRYGRYH